MRRAGTSAGLGILVAVAAVSCAGGSARKPHEAAYDGAPPTIPHGVKSLGRENCLACHLDGLIAGPGEVALPKPHRNFGDCRQCHVERNSGTPLFVETSFTGIPLMGRRHRAYPGAPPILPHRIFMRENCVACHGENGYAAIRTPHPDRRNCLQCHVGEEPSTPLFVESSFGKAP